MTPSLTITCPVSFQRASRGHRHIEAGAEPAAPVCPPGRVPRVARLLALALRFDAQVRQGVLASYAQLAELGHVSRARVSQIMNLLNLSTEIQEALLLLPRTEQGRDPIHLRQLQPIASTIAWRKQRRLWRDLTVARGIAPGS